MGQFFDPRNVNAHTVDLEECRRAICLLYLTVLFLHIHDC